MRTYDEDTVNVSSSEISSASSSDLSEAEIFIAEFRLLDQELSERSLRRPRNLYSVHTYLPFTEDERVGTVVDKLFAFSFDRAVLPQRYDLFFRSIHPRSPAVYNPSRISYSFRGTNTKVAILRGVYADQSGVIVEAYCRLLFHRVLVHDGSVLLIRQRDLKLLDPHRVLPFGYPVKNFPVPNNLA